MKYQDLEKNPGYQLWLATNAWQRLLRRSLDPVGLTHVQFILMASIDMLHHESQCVTQAEVSRYAATDENMTSQVIRSLAERGLLERGEHPTDARARCLSLTTEGERLLDQAKQAIRPARERFFAPLGDRSALLADLLREIVDAEEDHAV